MPSRPPDFAAAPALAAAPVESLAEGQRLVDAKSLVDAGKRPAGVGAHLQLWHPGRHSYGCGRGSPTYVSVRGCLYPVRSFDSLPSGDRSMQQPSPYFASGAPVLPDAELRRLARFIAK